MLPVALDADGSIGAPIRAEIPRAVGCTRASPWGTVAFVARVVKVASATIVVAGLLVWAYDALGPSSVLFALAIVWLPMIWLGIVSRFVRPRLPRRYHALRGFERSGRLYELLGVRIAKRLLRRDPFAAFNPDLHLPSEPDAARIAHLDQRMQDAEASHATLFALTIGVVVNAAVHGWMVAAAATLLFDIVLNGYPVMLQRYNRVLLARRYPSTLPHRMRAGPSGGPPT